MMEKCQITFISCVIFSLFFTELPSFSFVIVFTAISLLIFFKINKLLGVAFGGCCWFFIHALLQTQWTLDQQQIKQPLTVVGIVTDIPVITNPIFTSTAGTFQQPATTKFELKLLQIENEPLRSFFNPKLRLSWQADQQTIELGDQVKLVVKLKPSHGFANQGSYSFQKQLFEKGVRATGYVINDQPVTVITAGHHWRQRIFNRLVTATEQYPFQGVLLALTMGERQLMTADQWTVVKAHGISHLLAISGLHIGMIFMFATILSKWLLKTGCFVFNQQCNTPLWAMVMGLLAAFLYAWLAGFSIPTVRAFLMLSLLVFTVAMARPVNVKTIFITALFLILLFDPLSILAPGLWLSFLAVLVIVATFWFFPELSAKQTDDLLLAGDNVGRKVSAKIRAIRQGGQRYIKSLLKLQLAIFIILSPVTIIVFSGFSLSGGLVNLFAVPWVSTITIPAALSAVVLLLIGLPNTWLFDLANSSLTALFYGLEQPWWAVDFVTVQHLPWYIWLSLLIFAASGLIRMNKMDRAMSFLLLLPFVMAIVPSMPQNLLGPDLTDGGQPHHRDWTINILDVGQGLSVVIEQNQQVMVYDLGPHYPSGFNTVDAVVLPFLAYHGVDRVDHLIVSHGDNDHAGNYQGFLRQMAVDSVVAPPHLMRAANVCAAQQTQWQGLTIEMLWPLTPLIDSETSQLSRKKLSSNDSSCVVRVSDGEFSVLLPGDISKRVERQLVSRYGEQLKSTILIVPHHGSKSSSSPDFVKAVAPQYVVYSTGFYNRYGFPKQPVVDRYRQLASEDFNTAELGQISVKLTPGSLTILTAKQNFLPHWYYNQ